MSGAKRPSTEVPAPQANRSRVLRRFLRHGLAVASAWLLGFLALAAVFLVPYGEAEAYYGIDARRVHRGPQRALPRLGVGEPSASWGLMLATAQEGGFQTFASRPWMLLPGLSIFLVVLALNFVGDGVRDAPNEASPLRRGRKRRLVIGRGRGCRRPRPLVDGCCAPRPSVRRRP